jgi:thiol-disulfide isomerase/thioredoxin
MNGLIKLLGGLTILTLCSACAVEKATPAAAANEADESQPLQTRFFAREYVLGYSEGAAAVAKFPNDSRVAAWYVLNAARAGDGKIAMAAADELISRDTSDPWAHFAKAGALHWVQGRADELISESRQAYERRPGQVEFLWCYAESLRLRHRFVEALALLASQGPKVESNAQLLVVRGSIRFDQFLADTGNQAFRQSALDDFNTARKLDPKNVEASFAPGFFLSVSGNPTGAADYLRDAAALTTSPTVRGAYWQNLLTRSDMDLPARQALMRDDLNGLLHSRPHDPDTLALAAEGFRMLNDEPQATKLDDEIVAQAVPSAALDMVRSKRFWARMVGADSKTPQQRAANERELVEFLREPKLDGHARFDSAQLLLHLVAEDPAASSDTLSALADAWAAVDDDNRSMLYTEILRLLIVRETDISRAEKLALEGMDYFDQRAAQAEREAVRDVMLEMKNSARALLGWARFKLGRIDDAERDLSLSAKNPPEANPFVYSYLAELYLSQKENDTAELYIERCFAARWTQKNPCFGNLTAYYRQAQPGKQDEKQWVARRAKQLSGQRKQALAKQFRQSPRALRSIDLALLDGTRIRSAALKGKIVMVSFWGMWCGACMVELPELQGFATKHQKDEDFVVLTINNDEDKKELRKFVREKQLDFPIALDDGYALKAGIVAFPTTWFVSRQQDRMLEWKGLTPDLGKELELMLSTARASAN